MARPRIILAAVAVALSMVSMSLLGDTGTNRLANADPPVISINPDNGPPEGGGNCTLTGVNGFVLIDALKFTGIQSIDPGIRTEGVDGIGSYSPVEVVIDFQYTSLTSTESYLFGFSERGQTSISGAFQFSATSSQFKTYYGSTSSAITGVTANLNRHQVKMSNGKTYVDDMATPKVTWTNGGSFQGYYGPIYLGGYSIGSMPSPQNSAIPQNFSGYMYGVQIWQNGTQVRDMKPAAWNETTTTGTKTVYGFYDTINNKLYWDLKKTLQGGPASVSLSAQLGGQNLPLYYSSDAMKDTPSTPPVVTCGPIPAHAPGYVPLVVNANGTTTTVDNAYLYGTPAELKVVKRGWDCGNSTYTYDQIMDGACQEIASDPETILPSGKRVTWTYTVTYQDLSNQSTGLTDVIVTDDKILGQDGNPTQICHFDTLPINTPVGCVASGEVKAGP